MSSKTDRQRDEPTPRKIESVRVEDWESKKFWKLESWRKSRRPRSEMLWFQNNNTSARLSDRASRCCSVQGNVVRLPLTYFLGIERVWVWGQATKMHRINGKSGKECVTKVGQRIRSDLSNWILASFRRTARSLFSSKPSITTRPFFPSWVASMETR